MVILFITNFVECAGYFMGLLILSMVELVYYQFELLLSSECGIFPLTHIASILQHQHTDSTDIEGGL